MPIFEIKYKIISKSNMVHEVEGNNVSEILDIARQDAKKFEALFMIDDPNITVVVDSIKQKGE